MKKLFYSITRLDSLENELPIYTVKIDIDYAYYCIFYGFQREK